jgi:2-keto-3-deoxy-L-rhamnonate aldolase RhmA
MSFSAPSTCLSIGTETSALCFLFADKDIAPIVRISHRSAIEAAKALDAGAHGIVAPYVETIDQVRELVGTVHYRPVKGILLRAYQSGERPTSETMQQFFDRFNRNNASTATIRSSSASKASPRTHSWTI